MKCVMRAARQICFHLEILAAIVLPHIDVISKRSIAELNCSCLRALELVVERTHLIDCTEVVERIEFATFLLSEKPVI